ncbi:MAG TPA: hypothetical protein VI542_34820 [Candidatus Tectomicrobia bacterium]
MEKPQQQFSLWYFIIAAVAGTCVGAHVAGRIPAHGMRRVFAGFVIVVALMLIAANCRAVL